MSWRVAVSEIFIACNLTQQSKSVHPTPSKRIRPPRWEGESTFRLTLGYEKDPILVGRVKLMVELTLRIPWGTGKPGGMHRDGGKVPHSGCVHIEAGMHVVLLWPFARK